MNGAELLAAARSDLERGFTVRAATRFRQAIDAGNDQALRELVEAVFRRNLPGNSKEIRQRLENARGLSAASRMLRARWRYAGLGGAADRAGALRDLCAAAGDDAAARIEIALVWNERSPGSPQVRAWLSEAGAEGDLLAADIAGSREFAAPEMPTEWAGAAPLPHPEVYAEDPPIRAYSGLLDPLECLWLRTRAAPGLEPSRVIDPRSGRTLDNPIRTGSTACLDPSRPGIFDLRMAERMAIAGGSDLARAEPLAVLRYGVGEQYKPHFDWIGPAGMTRDPLARAGDRAATVLGYLNTPEGGGGTAFPQLGLTIPAREGCVVVFANISSAGEPLQDSRHAGEPVTAGEKWLASLWLRQRPVNAR